MDKQGKVPIYAKITINSQRIELSVNRKIDPEKWREHEGLLKSVSKEDKEVNTQIESFKSKIYATYSTLLAANQILNAENFKNLFYGDSKLNYQPTLLAAANQHNENFEKMVGIKYSYGSYKNYKTTLKYLIEFVPKYSGKKDIQLSEVNYEFCEAYFTYLTTEKTCKQNGANKQIQRLKKIINYSIRKGHLQSNPLATFSLEFAPVAKVALTLLELKQLRNLELKRDVLINVRDVFLLQCYTGLSYGDVKRLSKEHIHLVSKSEYMIKMSREKTKISFSVPLLPQAMEIINRHLQGNNTNDCIIQVLSNQKMNQNLKLIQELAGISKNLTTHLARHTFATTITLGHGVPIETVSKMLGHTKLATTQIYAKVLDGKIATDMQVLREKLEKS